jgi:hypothetical protein
VWGGQGVEKRQPVLVVHALMQDSESLLVGGKDYSLAIHLADAGFDVWLGRYAVLALVPPLAVPARDALMLWGGREQPWESL